MSDQAEIQVAQPLSASDLAPAAGSGAPPTTCSGVNVPSAPAPAPAQPPAEVAPAPSEEQPSAPAEEPAPAPSESEPASAPAPDAATAEENAPAVPAPAEEIKPDQPVAPPAEEAPKDEAAPTPAAEAPAAEPAAPEPAAEAPAAAPESVVAEAPQPEAQQEPAPAPTSVPESEPSAPAPAAAAESVPEAAPVVQGIADGQPIVAAVAQESEAKPAEDSVQVQQQPESRAAAHESAEAEAAPAAAPEEAKPVEEAAPSPVAEPAPEAAAAAPEEPPQEAPKPAEASAEAPAEGHVEAVAQAEAAAPEAASDPVEPQAGHYGSRGGIEVTTPTSEAGGAISGGDEGVDWESNTSQQRESIEEGYVDEQGNLIISKKVTRIVTTTKTVYGDGEPKIETSETVQTTESADKEPPASQEAELPSVSAKEEKGPSYRSLADDERREAERRAPFEFYHREAFEHHRPPAPPSAAFPTVHPQPNLACDVSGLAEQQQEISPVEEYPLGGEVTLVSVGVSPTEEQQSHLHKEAHDGGVGRVDSGERVFYEEEVITTMPKDLAERMQPHEASTSVRDRISMFERIAQSSPSPPRRQISPTEAEHALAIDELAQRFEPSAIPQLVRPHREQDVTRETTETTTVVRATRAGEQGLRWDSETGALEGRLSLEHAEAMLEREAAPASGVKEVTTETVELKESPMEVVEERHVSTVRAVGGYREKTETVVIRRRARTPGGSVEGSREGSPTEAEVEKARYDRFNAEGTPIHKTTTTTTTTTEDEVTGSRPTSISDQFQHEILRSEEEHREHKLPGHRIETEHAESPQTPKHLQLLLEQEDQVAAVPSPIKEMSFEADEVLGSYQREESPVFEPAAVKIGSLHKEKDLEDIPSMSHSVEIYDFKDIRHEEMQVPHIPSKDSFYEEGPVTPAASRDEEEAPDVRKTSIEIEKRELEARVREIWEHERLEPEEPLGVTILEQESGLDETWQPTYHGLSEPEATSPFISTADEEYEKRHLEEAYGYQPLQAEEEEPEPSPVHEVHVETLALRAEPDGLDEEALILAPATCYDYEAEPESEVHYAPEPTDEVRHAVDPFVVLYSTFAAASEIVREHQPAVTETISPYPLEATHDGLDESYMPPVPYHEPEIITKEFEFAQTPQQEPEPFRYTLEEIPIHSLYIEREPLYDVSLPEIPPYEVEERKRKSITEPLTALWGSITSAVGRKEKESPVSAPSAEAVFEDIEPTSLHQERDSLDESFRAEHPIQAMYKEPSFEAEYPEAPHEPPQAYEETYERTVITTTSERGHQEEIVEHVAHTVTFEEPSIQPVSLSREHDMLDESFVPPAITEEPEEEEIGHISERHFEEYKEPSPLAEHPPEFYEEERKAEPRIQILELEQHMLYESFRPDAEADIGRLGEELELKKPSAADASVVTLESFEPETADVYPLHLESDQLDEDYIPESPYEITEAAAQEPVAHVPLPEAYEEPKIHASYEQLTTPKAEHFEERAHADTYERPHEEEIQPVPLHYQHDALHDEPFTGLPHAVDPFLTLWAVSAQAQQPEKHEHLEPISLAQDRDMLDESYELPIPEERIARPPEHEVEESPEIAEREHYEAEAYEQEPEEALPIAIHSLHPEYDFLDEMYPVDYYHEEIPYVPLQEREDRILEAYEEYEQREEAAHKVETYIFEEAEIPAEEAGLAQDIFSLRYEQDELDETFPAPLSPEHEAIEEPSAPTVQAIEKRIADPFVAAAFAEGLLQQQPHGLKDAPHHAEFEEDSTDAHDTAFVPGMYPVHEERHTRISEEYYERKDISHAEEPAPPSPEPVGYVHEAELEPRSLHYDQEPLDENYEPEEELVPTEAAIHELEEQQRRWEEEQASKSKADEIARPEHSIRGSGIGTHDTHPEPTSLHYDKEGLHPQEVTELESPTVDPFVALYAALEQSKEILGEHEHETPPSPPKEESKYTTHETDIAEIPHSGEPGQVESQTEIYMLDKAAIPSPYELDDHALPEEVEETESPNSAYWKGATAATGDVECFSLHYLTDMLDESYRSPEYSPEPAFGDQEQHSGVYESETSTTIFMHDQAAILTVYFTEPHDISDHTATEPEVLALPYEHDSLDENFPVDSTELEEDLARRRQQPHELEGRTEIYMLDTAAIPSAHDLEDTSPEPIPSVHITRPSTEEQRLDEIYEEYSERRPWDVHYEEDEDRAKVVEVLEPTTETEAAPLHYDRGDLDETYNPPSEALAAAVDPFVALWATVQHGIQTAADELKSGAEQPSAQRTHSEIEEDVAHSLTQVQLLAGHTPTDEAGYDVSRPEHELEIPAIVETRVESLPRSPDSEAEAATHEHYIAFHEQETPESPETEAFRHQVLHSTDFGRDQFGESSLHQLTNDDHGLIEEHFGHVETHTHEVMRPDHLELAKTADTGPHTVTTPTTEDVPTIAELAEAATEPEKRLHYEEGEQPLSEQHERFIKDMASSAISEAQQSFLEQQKLTAPESAPPPPPYKEVEESPASIMTTSYYHGVSEAAAHALEEEYPHVTTNRLQLEDEGLHHREEPASPEDDDSGVPPIIAYLDQRRRDEALDEEGQYLHIREMPPSPTQEHYEHDRSIEKQTPVSTPRSVDEMAEDMAIIATTAAADAARKLTKSQEQLYRTEFAEPPETWAVPEHTITYDQSGIHNQEVEDDRSEIELSQKSEALVEEVLDETLRSAAEISPIEYSPEHHGYPYQEGESQQPLEARHAVLDSASSPYWETTVQHMKISLEEPGVLPPDTRLAVEHPDTSSDDERLSHSPEGARLPTTSSEEGQFAGNLQREVDSSDQYFSAPEKRTSSDYDTALTSEGQYQSATEGTTVLSSTSQDFTTPPSGLSDFSGAEMSRHEESEAETITGGSGHLSEVEPSPRHQMGYSKLREDSLDREDQFEPRSAKEGDHNSVHEESIAYQYDASLASSASTIVAMPHTALKQQSLTESPVQSDRSFTARAEEEEKEDAFLHEERPPGSEAGDEPLEEIAEASESAKDITSPSPDIEQMSWSLQDVPEVPELKIDEPGLSFEKGEEEDVELESEMHDAFGAHTPSGLGVREPVERPWSPVPPRSESEEAFQHVEPQDRAASRSPPEHSEETPLPTTIDIPEHRPAPYKDHEEQIASLGSSIALTSSSDTDMLERHIPEPETFYKSHETETHELDTPRYDLPIPQIDVLHRIEDNLVETWVPSMGFERQASIESVSSVSLKSGEISEKIKSTESLASIKSSESAQALAKQGKRYSTSRRGSAGSRKSSHDESPTFSERITPELQVTWSPKEETKSLPGDVEVTSGKETKTSPETEKSSEEERPQSPISLRLEPSDQLLDFPQAHLYFSESIAAEGQTEGAYDARYSSDVQLEPTSELELETVPEEAEDEGPGSEAASDDLQKILSGVSGFPPTASALLSGSKRSSRHGSSDNVSEASLVEFERLERELALRGDTSLSSSEVELFLAAQRRRASDNGSQNSLAEFERLEKEVDAGDGSGSGSGGKGSPEQQHQQPHVAIPVATTSQTTAPTTAATTGPQAAAQQDVMILSDIREESEPEDMSTRDDDEEDATADIQYDLDSILAQQQEHGQRSSADVMFQQPFRPEPSTPTDGATPDEEKRVHFGHMQAQDIEQEVQHREHQTSMAPHLHTEFEPEDKGRRLDDTDSLEDFEIVEKSDVSGHYSHDQTPRSEVTLGRVVSPSSSEDSLKQGTAVGRDTERVGEEERRPSDAIAQVFVTSTDSLELHHEHGPASAQVLSSRDSLDREVQPDTSPKSDSRQKLPRDDSDDKDSLQGYELVEEKSQASAGLLAGERSEPDALRTGEMERSTVEIVFESHAGAAISDSLEDIPKATAKDHHHSELGTDQQPSTTYLLTQQKFTTDYDSGCEKDSVLASSFYSGTDEMETAPSSQETHGLLSGDTVGTYQEYEYAQGGADEGDRDSLTGDLDEILHRNVFAPEPHTPVAESPGQFSDKRSDTATFQETLSPTMPSSSTTQGRKHPSEDVAEDIPYTFTTYETSQEHGDGSVEIITRTVSTRVVDPVADAVRFTGPGAQEKLAEYLRHLEEQNEHYEEFESIDEMGNITKTVVRRVRLPSTPSPEVAAGVAPHAATEYVEAGSDNDEEQSAGRSAPPKISPGRTVHFMPGTVSIAPLTHSDTRDTLSSQEDSAVSATTGTASSSTSLHHVTAAFASSSEDTSPDAYLHQRRHPSHHHSQEQQSEYPEHEQQRSISSTHLPSSPGTREHLQLDQGIKEPRITSDPSSPSTYYTFSQSHRHQSPSVTTPPFAHSPFEHSATSYDDGRGKIQSPTAATIPEGSFSGTDTLLTDEVRHRGRHDDKEDAEKEAD